MEQCRASRCDRANASPQDLESRKVLKGARGRRGAAARGKSVTTDHYDCRICGYKAANVRVFSQHLHSSHPVTALPGPSALSDDRNRGNAEGIVQVTCVDQSSEGQGSPAARKTLLSEGPTLSLSKHSQMSRSTSAVENQVAETEQKGTVKSTTAAESTKSTSPASILPQRKASTSSGSTKGNQSEDSASSGTAGLNRTPLVCLPLVSDGLKLVWVRSEQTRELDGVSELVEAFNAFPYPTEQEASALARRCALPEDRVKVWFMMQRVRYGISWADTDIHQTRLRLRLLRGVPAREGLQEEEDDDDELRDFLAHEKTRQEGPRRDFKQANARDACMGQPHHAVIRGTSLLQRCASEYSSDALVQFSATGQYTNGSERLEYRTQAQHTGAFERSSLHTLPPPSHSPPTEAETQIPGVFVCPPHPSSDVHHSSAAMMHPARGQSCRAPTTQLRKKSKAQLMVLRRSFVHRNWPTEAEVQRLQRVTGLGRHEIRKWFADSRYQLRRSGRGWPAGDGRRSRPQQLLGRFRRRLDAGGPFEANQAVGSGAGFEFELDVETEGKRGPLVEEVGGSDALKDIKSDKLELGNGHASIKQEQQEIDVDLSVDPSPSPSSSSPSPSFLRSQAPSAGPEPYLRKKTREQLDVLRQSFLRCQWPSSDDYTVLQRKTGLTRTEIVQWFGDTRYHIKHSNMRWMSPENRERIIAGLTKQQRRGGRGIRSRAWPEVADGGFSSEVRQSSNGTAEAEVRTWDGLYRPSPSGLAGGEL